MTAKRLKKATLLLSANVVLLAVLLEGGAFLLTLTTSHDSGRAGIRERLLMGAEMTVEESAAARESSEFAPNAVLHPYLGFVRKPGLTAAEGRHSELEVSRFGFLGDHSNLKRSDDEVIVAISGGSVAGGFFQQGTETLRQHLAPSPSFAGKKIRFVSFALAGYKQPQALMSLTYFLALGAEFDFWINLDGFNEVVLPLAENLPAQVSPDYPRMWNLYARKIPDRDVLLAMAKAETARDDREALRQRFAGPLLSRSSFCLLIWDNLDRVKGRQISEQTEAINALLFESAPSPQTSGPAYEQAPLSEVDALNEATRLWKESSIQMAQLCAANGIEYYHFLQPNQHLAGSKVLSAEEKSMTDVSGGYAPFARTGYPALIAAGVELSEANVAFHDLTQIYSSESRTFYIDTCCHVNELGNELMAEAIAEAIVGSRTR